MSFGSNVFYTTPGTSVRGAATRIARLHIFFLLPSLDLSCLVAHSSSVSRALFLPFSAVFPRFPARSFFFPDFTGFPVCTLPLSPFTSNSRLASFLSFSITLYHTVLASRLILHYHSLSFFFPPPFPSTYIHFPSFFLSPPLVTPFVNSFLTTE